jgi:hypothetical protein
MWQGEPPCLFIMRYFGNGEMITMQKTKEKKIDNEDLLTFDNFLLTQESSQQAFINLSKTRNEVSTEELLNETKRILQEHIIEQIKANQVNLKKHRHVKSCREKIRKT